MKKIRTLLVFLTAVSVFHVQDLAAQMQKPSFKGVFLTDTGAPVSGLPVTMISLGGPPNPRTTGTAPDGTFMFGNLANGSYRITADLNAHSEYRERFFGHRSVTFEIRDGRFSAGQPFEEIRLEPFGSKKSMKLLENSIAYGIFLVGTDLCIDVREGRKEKGAVIQLFPFNDTEAQHWQVQMENGGFAIRNTGSGMFLRSVPGTGSRAKVELWSGSDTMDQRWNLQPTGAKDENRFLLVNQNGKLLISASGEKPAEGMLLELREKNLKIAQIFEFRPLRRLPRNQEGPQTAGPDRGQEKPLPAHGATPGEPTILKGRTLALTSISSSDLDRKTRDLTEDFLTNALINTGNLKLVDRKNVQAIISEYEFQNSDLSDAETAVKIGKIAGADAIVTGTLERLGENFYLTVRIISTETGEILSSGVSEGKKTEDLLSMSKKLVESMKL